MKKLIFVLVFAAMASASFADFSITGWQLQSRKNYRYTTVDSVMNDAAPNGFDYQMNAENRSEYSVISVRGYVSDWVFDESDVITVSISGFDDLSMGDSPYALDTLAFSPRSENNHVATYVVDYAGDGTYKVGAADARDFVNYIANGESISFVDIALGKFSVGSGYIDGVLAKVTEDTAGSVYVLFGDAEFEFGNVTPEVPEPGAIAYGAAGLVSLIGIKRRIKK